MGRKKIRLEPFSGRKVIFVFTTFTRDIEVHGWSKTFFDREKIILREVTLNARARRPSTFSDVTSQDMHLEIRVLCSLRCLGHITEGLPQDHLAHKTTPDPRPGLTTLVGPSRLW